MYKLYIGCPAETESASIQLHLQNYRKAKNAAI